MIQLLKLTASKLHNRKLKGLTGEELSGLLGEVQARFHLDNVDEAVVFTALFDCGCGGRKNDLNDLVAYFDCTLLQMMEYVVAIRSLIRKHLVIQTNKSESRVVEQMFMIPDYVIESILENKMPHPKEYMQRNAFNQYDFCKAIDKILRNRSSSEADSLSRIEFLERENAEMSLVKELKGVVPQLDNRMIFYQRCFDFTENSNSNVDDILEDIYMNYGVRLQAKHALLTREHPLVVAGLIELVDKKYLELTTAGERLFLGEDFERLKTNVETDCYGFAKMVEEYIDRSRHGTKTARDTYRIEAKLVAMERDNHHISSLAKVQNLIEEPGYRILFYLACEGCINGSGVELVILNRIYSPKDCSANLSLFKNGLHKLQQLDLVEMVTESSSFGKQTKLILTDQGKELYFGEDALFFMEKVDSKGVIQASDRYSGKTALLFARRAGATVAGRQRVERRELSDIGRPARGQIAPPGNSRLAVWGTGYGQNRVGHAVGPPVGTRYCAGRYKCLQEHVVWREREDCQADIYPLSQYMQALGIETYPVVQRGRHPLFYPPEPGG